MLLWVCKGLQLASYLFSVNCSTAGFWTPLHSHRVHDQVLFSSIMLHCSLVLILLCICYVKRFGLRTHCWRWGCLWHLTARRAYSQSLPLWMASTEEIHLRHRKHFVTAVSKICRPQFSLSLSPCQYSNIPFDYYHFCSASLPWSVSIYRQVLMRIQQVHILQYQYSW